MKNLLNLLYLGIAFSLSCNSTKPPSKQSSSEKKDIENQGVKIAYTDTGSGDTTLVFVHGWGINKGYWSDQVSAFSNRYRVVTLDLPGFGQSGKNRTVWNTEIYGGDIDSVLSQLDLKKVILVGHSMAGDIVLQAALHATGRVIGLVGVDNFKGIGYKETPQDKQSEAAFYEQMRHHFKQVVSEYCNQYLFYKTTPDTIRQRVLNDITSADTVIAVASLENQSLNEVEALSALKKKLCLINSDGTPNDTGGLAANHLPFQLFIVHATGHYPMIEKPGEFNALLGQAIASFK